MRLPPDQFWQMSLAEWRLLCAAEGTGLSRDAFDELRTLYPDTVE